MYERQIAGKRPHFRPRRRSSFYRVIVLIGLILTGVWILLSWQRGQVEPLFQPTPTPTRTARSYILEAQAYFEAGKLDNPDPPLPTPPNPDAIDTYKRALELDPTDSGAMAELARIMAYSSRLLRNDTERLARMKEALEFATRSVELAPDESENRAIRAFVLDWYATNPLVPDDESASLLNEANNEAVRAFNLNPNNALALAYYSEILVDQQKWSQARNYAEQAVILGPDLMDTHRTLGYVQESWGEYNAAIRSYQRAAEITPNMTFLYILIGQNFREGIQNPERALEYFDRAAKINEQLGVENPIPYIEIARTYSQQGEFFIASINAEKALALDNTNAQTYGQLGIIFIQSRNYEGAMPMLKCAVRGCTPEENELGKVAVDGLPLSNLTVAYYYVEYGTVLAFLSRANDNHCPDALPVLEEVRTTFPEDTILNEIVQDSEGICRRLQGEMSAPTATPSP